jgi:hypothetical protein
VPTAIAVTSADLTLPGPGQNVPPALVLPVDAAQPLKLDEQLTQVLLALEHYSHVVALVPADLAPAARRRLYTVRAILETDRVALVETGLPPLATALLAQQLRTLTVTDLGPGVIAGASRLLSYYLHAGAVLTSVAKLDRVQVEMKHHLLSWVPGRQFVVLANPEPRLDQISPATHLPGPNFVTHLAFGAHGMPHDWVTTDLVRQWRPQHVHETQLPAASTQWWGSPRLVEFAAHIPDPGVLYRLVTSVRRDTCAWCGLEAIGDQCLFCSARLDGHVPELGAAGARQRPA